MNSCSPSLTTRDLLHMHSAVAGQHRLGDLDENRATDCGAAIETTKMETAERVSDQSDQESVILHVAITASPALRVADSWSVSQISLSESSKTCNSCRPLNFLFFFNSCDFPAINVVCKVFLVMHGLNIWCCCACGT